VDPDGRDPFGKDPITPDFSKVTNVENVLAGKPWIDFYITMSCGASARNQNSQICMPQYKQINMVVNPEVQAKNPTSPPDIQKGIDVIIKNLQEGKPVMVGVSYVPNAGANNENKETDHYINIVGMGTDENGNVYFSYYDNFADNYEYPNEADREKIGTDVKENRFFWDQENQVLYDDSWVPINGIRHGEECHKYVVTEVKDNQ